jgi:phasin family protein
VQGYDQLAAFNKATVEALMQAANAASKGLEAINAEALAFSRQTIEESVAAAKAAIGTKSIQELIELQSDYTKQAFDSYFGEVTKIGDLMASITKEATEPLNSRVAAFVEMVQGARVA